MALKKKMRILQVAISGYPEHRGGVNTIIHTLVRQLRDHNHLVVLIPGKWSDKKPRIISDGGIRTYKLHLRKPPDGYLHIKSFIGWLIGASRTLIELYFIIRKEGINVISVQLLTGDMYFFRLLCLIGGPPYVLTIRGTDIRTYPEQSWIERTLRSWVYYGAAAVIANSHHSASLAAVHLPKKRTITVIHNGVDKSGQYIIGDQNLTRNYAVPNTYFVSVGALDYVKGHDILINAWPTVLEWIPDCHLLIVGDGDCREAYESLINKLGCGNRVHLLGQLPNPETLSLIQKAVALILPSRHEGLGNVLLEAGTVGTPVIASAVGGVLEIVFHETNGLLVPPDDPKAIARSVSRLVRDTELRRNLGLALKDRVQKHFNAEQMAKRYFEIYQQVRAAAC